MFNGEYKPMFLEFKVHHYYLFKFVSILCFVGGFLLLKCFVAYDGILLGVILTASPGLKHSAPQKRRKIVNGHERLAPKSNKSYVILIW